MEQGIFFLHRRLIQSVKNNVYTLVKKKTVLKKSPQNCKMLAQHVGQPKYMYWDPASYDGRGL